MDWSCGVGFGDWESLGFAIDGAGAAEHKRAAVVVIHRGKHAAGTAEVYVPISERFEHGFAYCLEACEVNHGLKRVTTGTGVSEQLIEQNGITHPSTRRAGSKLGDSIKGYRRLLAKLSSTTSSARPASGSTTHVWLPMKPAPPVEQTGHGFKR